MYDAQYCTSTAFKFNIRPEIMQTMQKLMKEQNKRAMQGLLTGSLMKTGRSENQSTDEQRDDSIGLDVDPFTSPDHYDGTYSRINPFEVESKVVNAVHQTEEDGDSDFDIDDPYALTPRYGACLPLAHYFIIF